MSNASDNRVSRNRNCYAAAHANTDPRPSRFADEGRAYRAWAERADAWAASDPYKRGTTVLFDGVPAVVLESDWDAEALTIATHAGMQSIIGMRHSKLTPLDESTIGPVFAERIAELRAYYRTEASA